jgi:hypothetical protein
MINFKCKKCGEKLEAPESLAGEAIKCPKCNLYSDIPKPIKTITSNAIISLWQKSPAAFRTGFLTTLGVLAAIIASFYLYNNVLSSSPVKKAASAQPAKKSIFHKPLPTDSFETCKLFLEKQGLFLKHSEAGVLRGRSLYEHVFSPDVNFGSPSLSIWVDTENNLCGFSAVWYVWIMEDEGTAEILTILKIANSSGKLHRGHWMVKNTFNKLVNPKKTINIEDNIQFAKQPLDNAHKEAGLKEEIGFKTFDNWAVQINRRLLDLDNNGKNVLLRIGATAQNW